LFIDIHILNVILLPFLFIILLSNTLMERFINKEDNAEK